MTDYNKLAKECLDKYPNRKIVVFMNPNYIGGVCQLGEYDDVETLAKDLKEAKSMFAEIGDNFGIDWLDVFPVKYTTEEIAELERKDQEWFNALEREDDDELEREVEEELERRHQEYADRLFGDCD